MSTEDRSMFVTVYLPIAGWKAVLYGYTVEDGYEGWEPYETSYFAYSSKADAERSAKAWAKDLDVRYVKSNEPDVDASDKSVTEQLRELIPGIKVVTLK